MKTLWQLFWSFARIGVCTFGGGYAFLVHGFRSKLYRFVRAELMEPSDSENIYAELNELYDYKLTY